MSDDQGMHILPSLGATQVTERDFWILMENVRHISEKVDDVQEKVSPLAARVELLERGEERLRDRITRLESIPRGMSLDLQQELISYIPEIRTGVRIMREYNPKAGLTNEEMDWVRMFYRKDITHSSIWGIVPRDIFLSLFMVILMFSSVIIQHLIWH